MPVDSPLLPVRRPYAHCPIQRGAPTAVTQRTQHKRRGPTRNGERGQPAEAAAIEQHITTAIIAVTITAMTRCSHLLCFLELSRKRERMTAD
jgi:hypothetical protein